MFLILLMVCLEGCLTAKGLFHNLQLHFWRPLLSVQKQNIAFY